MIRMNEIREIDLAAMKGAPLECILIETDAPVLYNNKGKVSQPADLVK